MPRGPAVLLLLSAALQGRDSNKQQLELKGCQHRDRGVQSRGTGEAVNAG